MDSRIARALQDIDERIDNNSLPFSIKIVSYYTQDKKAIQKASLLLKTALTLAYLLDLYSETDDIDYLTEAKKQRVVLYNSIPGEQKKEFLAIERRVRRFFDYEKNVLEKMKSGKTISNKAIEKFMRLKSSDALFYGRIILIFTNGKDFTLPLYVNMQLLDIMGDIQGYERDWEESAPNFIYMKLSPKIPLREIPESKKEALKKCKALGINAEIEQMVQKLVNSLESYDFGNCIFIWKEIKRKQSVIEKELAVAK